MSVEDRREQEHCRRLYGDETVPARAPKYGAQGDCADAMGDSASVERTRYYTCRLARDHGGGTKGRSV